MPEGFGLGQLNSVGVVGLCLIFTFLLAKDVIVSGRRLRRAEADRDKWEAIALDAIRSAGKAIIPAAETVHALVKNLPDPGAEKAKGDESS